MGKGINENLDQKKSITAQACQSYHGAVTRSPGYHCKVTKRVLFAMDRVHTQSYEVHTVGGESGKQFCDLSSIQMTQYICKDKKTYFLRHP